MANDIYLIKIGTPINNGSLIASCYPTGKFSRSLAKTINKPTISQIESKYDDRFDDVGYYFGGVSADGGFYGDSVDGGEL